MARGVKRQWGQQNVIVSHFGRIMYILGISRAAKASITIQRHGALYRLSSGFKMTSNDIEMLF